MGSDTLAERYRDPVMTADATFKGVIQGLDQLGIFDDLTDADCDGIIAIVEDGAAAFLLTTVILTSLDGPGRLMRRKYARDEEARGDGAGEAPDQAAPDAGAVPATID
jgi:hypothetical protein